MTPGEELAGLSAVAVRLRRPREWAGFARTLAATYPVEATVEAAALLRRGFAEDGEVEAGVMRLPVLLSSSTVEFTESERREPLPLTTWLDEWRPGWPAERREWWLDLAAVAFVDVIDRIQQEANRALFAPAEHRPRHRKHRRRHP